MNKINFQNGTLVAKAKVTINGTVYEVEPAEYEGTTPLNAENLNQIQTNAENAINTVQSNLNTTNQSIENLTTYSTTEKVVGTWIDGKPVYEITKIGTKQEESELEISIPNNIKKIISIDGTITTPSGITYNLNRTESENFTRAEVYTDSNLFRLRTHGMSSYYSGEVIVTLRYTKTTD